MLSCSFECIVVFFFKQKTAYEMRISDWSSDVCSSDLLATAPKVVLLDEPASGLDDVETQRLAEVLGRLRADGLAILLVEHDIDLVMNLCSKIYVLDLGRVIASGPPEEVRNDPGVREAYLGAAA